MNNWYWARLISGNQRKNCILNMNHRRIRWSHLKPLIGSIGIQLMFIMEVYSSQLGDEGIIDRYCAAFNWESKEALLFDGLSIWKHRTNNNEWNPTLLLKWTFIGFNGIQTWMYDKSNKFHSIGNIWYTNGI